MPGIRVSPAGPAAVSHDEGRTWQVVDLDEKGLTIAHSPVAEVFDGEFLCVPMPLGYRPEIRPTVRLPPITRCWECPSDSPPKGTWREPLVTGAGGGVIEAANRGAGRECGFGLGIRLPFELLTLLQTGG
jgi:hypothetical protein